MMYPSGEMMTPEPKPDGKSLGASLC